MLSNGWLGASLMSVSHGWDGRCTECLLNITCLAFMTSFSQTTTLKESCYCEPHLSLLLPQSTWRNVTWPQHQLLLPPHPTVAFAHSSQLPWPLPLTWPRQACSHVRALLICLPRLLPEPSADPPRSPPNGASSERCP